MAHTCKSVLIRCMDFRLEDAIERFLAERNLVGDCDIISVNGATKALMSDDQGQVDFLLAQFGIAYNLNGVRHFILMGHTDCDAYDDRDDTGTTKEDYDLHEEHLQKAKEILLEQFKDAKIELIIADIADDGAVEFRSVV